MPARVARASNRRTLIVPETPTTNTASPARGCRWIRVLSSVAAAAAQGSTTQADRLDHLVGLGRNGLALGPVFAATPVQVEALAAEWWR
ncbi:hypothetical protein [Streptomyces sp. NPDC002599]|uniref:hypothetical protein n=1 Tax=Streptomyces sp. NPDC002599 TaxID=3154421 RepID=UPI0033172835